MKPNKLVSSIFSLGLIQGADYVFPMLSIPYLVRVLGVDNYGKIAFAQAFCTYFLILVDYGFSLSATRDAAILREKKEELSRLFFSVQCAKFFLLVLSFIFFFALMKLLSLGNDWRLYFISMLPIVGSVFYPIWFLQGVEKLKIAAIGMVCCRLISLSLIFIYVTVVDDYLLAALLLNIPSVVIGVFILIILWRIRMLRLVIPSVSDICEKIVNGFSVFLGIAASSIYRSSNTFVLGLVAEPRQVAFYAISEKVVRAVQEIGKPIFQACYPRIANHASESRQRALDFIGILLPCIAFIFFSLGLILFVFSREISLILGGSSAMGASSVLMAMAFIPLIGGINNVIGVQTLLVFDGDASFGRSVFLAGVFNLSIIYPLVHFYSAVGAGISYLACEAFLMILFLGQLKSSHINLRINLSPVIDWLKG